MVKQPSHSAEEVEYQQQTHDARVYLSSRAAAVYLGISMSFLYKLTHYRRIPYYKPSGKLCYFKQSDLDVWMGQNRQSTSQEIEQSAAAFMTLQARRGK